MNLIPQKLFVNLYPKAIGPCVGGAYESQEDADRCANSHRLACVELGARLANTVVISEVQAARLADVARRSQIDPETVVSEALAIRLALTDEIRGLVYRYAAEHSISFPAAVSEICRAYLTEAAR